MRPLILLLAGSVTLLGLGAPQASSQTITDLVLQSGTPGEFDDDNFDYDFLLQAAVLTGVAADLGDPNENLTVFAPNDFAFLKLANNLGYVGKDEAAAWEFLVEQLDALSGGDPVGLLTQILDYHIVEERITAFGFILKSFFGQLVETRLGATFRPFFLVLIDNEPDLQNPRLFLPLNVEAENGIIHTITRVLIPLDIP